MATRSKNSKNNKRSDNKTDYVQEVRSAFGQPSTYEDPTRRTPFGSIKDAVKQPDLKTEVETEKARKRANKERGLDENGANPQGE